MYLHNFGRTQVNSAFSCYLASATGWTFPKPPAIFATLPVRWLSFRANSNLVVLLSISNGRTSAKSLAAQILFVICKAMIDVIKYRTLPIYLLFLFTALHTYGQTKTIIDKDFYHIKFIPSDRIIDSFSIPKYKLIDSSYNNILKFGIKAIPFLMIKMTDTTLSNISNPCNDDKRMNYGDLAWFLIMDIEKIPLFTVTKTQWCVWGVCEHFPLGFFESLNLFRTKYSKNYLNYFYSKERLRILKERVALE